jgi:hypothetical protein
MKGRIYVGISAVFVSAGIITACGSQTTSSPSTVTVAPSTVTVATPTVAQSSVAAAAAEITIPEIPDEENAKIVRDNLESLGLTNVSLSSANPKYSMVIMAENWTFVSIEPAPGTVVKADAPVVVKVTKP